MNWNCQASYGPIVWMFWLLFAICWKSSTNRLIFIPISPKFSYILFLKNESCSDDNTTSYKHRLNADNSLHNTNIKELNMCTKVGKCNSTCWSFGTFPMLLKSTLLSWIPINSWTIAYRTACEKRVAHILKICYVKLKEAFIVKMSKL